MPKLSVACFAATIIKPFVTQDNLKMVYHSYFHSIINYRIIYWENSSYSNIIFKLQKRIIRIVMGVGIRDSSRGLFKILKILPLVPQYTFSLLFFMVNNKNQFQMNSEIYNVNNRNNSNFYQPLTHLTIYQKDPFYMGIKVHNSQPHEIKDLSHNIKKFKSFPRGFLQQLSFYTLEEYISYKEGV